MLELVKAGGWPMIPLLLLTVVALGIILERFWSLRRKTVLPPGLGAEVRAWAARGNLDPTHIDSLRRTSPLGALLAAALDVRHRPRDQIRERIEDVGRHLVHRMERFLNGLGTIAAAGPLLGLFGSGDGAPALVDSDRSQVRAAEARAYRAAEGKPVHWQNPRSGAFGEIVPLGGVRRQGDRVCRDFRHMVMVAGRSFEGRGPACGRATMDDGRQG